MEDPGVSRQDLLHLCVRNLLRRKARTILTILGMLIGCSSIIIMVSLGMGMRQAREKVLSELGDLTIITVRPPSSNRSSGRLDNALVDQLRNMDGVSAVSPKLTLDVSSVTLSTGDGDRYLAEWTNVVGVDTAAMEAMGYVFLEGTPATQSGQAVIGEYFAYNFRDTTLPEGADIIDRFGGEWDDQGNQLTIPDPFFNPLSRPYTMEIETDSGQFSVPVDLVGKIKADYSKGNETAEGILIPMEDLLRLQAQANGISESDVVYDSILVKVSRVNRVEGVENRIKAMGYSTESMEEVRKPMEKEAQHQQMMLGGLGAISLLVATLGIINTMIMSIGAHPRDRHYESPWLPGLRYSLHVSHGSGGHRPHWRPAGLRVQSASLRRHQFVCRRPQPRGFPPRPDGKRGYDPGVHYPLVAAGLRPGFLCADRPGCRILSRQQSGAYSRSGGH